MLVPSQDSFGKTRPACTCLARHELGSDGIINTITNIITIIIIIVACSLTRLTLPMFLLYKTEIINLIQLLCPYQA